MDNIYIYFDYTMSVAMVFSTLLYVYYAILNGFYVTAYWP